MNELLNRTAPLNKKDLFARMREIIALGAQVMPKIPRYNGTGGPGNFLEDLIGLRAGNMDIADIIGWEVKYYTPQTNYITLFHKEPGPAGIMRYMVSKYGWKDAQGRLSFRHTIAGRTDRFQVWDDAGNVIVRPLKGNGPVPIWTHDTILNAANKLKRLLLVKGERSGDKVKFFRADMFESLHLTLLVSELINGTVAIDFDAREMHPGGTALRNHGTKFRVMPDNVCRLYLKKERFT
ncbi:MAG: MvaI/BcnI family restriction endonuclease [Pyrinomonadaceae bacterium]